MRRKLVVATVCFLILIVLMGSAPALAKGRTETDHYTATTADGVDLALKRYRPDNSARFHNKAQPIVLLPGLLSSMNEFDTRTPEGETYDAALPSPLAPWAKGDKYIQKDPMRYYSMAHYLWLQGYDVWMANYRGEGRDPYTSGGGNGYSLDDLGIYDAPAIVEKVYEVTGKHPIWFGHSMGSTMAFIYLQGARYGEGDNPHVVSDPALVAERNNGDGPQSIKALIDMDGPMAPMNGEMLDNSLVWGALYFSWYVDLRGLMIPYGESIVGPIAGVMGDWLWNVLQSFGLPDLGPLNTLVSINRQNLDPAVYDYGIKYCFDGMSTRTYAQYADSSAHQRFREDYFNGNWDFFPPDPAPGDGYYYYSDADNLAKVTIPALVLADSRRDITNPADIQRLYDSKTRTSFDQFMQIPDAAHVDIVCGLNAPTITYPAIGSWLKKLMRRK